VSPSELIGGAGGIATPVAAGYDVPMPAAPGNEPRADAAVNSDEGWSVFDCCEHGRGARKRSA